MKKFKCKCGLEFDTIEEYQKHIIMCPVYKLDVIKSLPAHNKKTLKKISLYSKGEKVVRPEKSHN